MVDQLTSTLRRLSLEAASDIRSVSDAHVESSSASGSGSVAASVDRPYNVLLLGEGNFSFARAAAQHHSDWCITATDISTSLTNAKNKSNNCMHLERNGHTVLHEVDALDIAGSGLELDDYDLVMFNFPYIARSPKSTCELILRFLEVMRGCKEASEIVLGLATQKPSTGRVAYQYGTSAENLVAKANQQYTYSNCVYSPSILLELIEVDHGFYEPFKKLGYAHCSSYDGSPVSKIWVYNSATAFRFIVRHIQFDIGRNVVDAHKAFCEAIIHGETQETETRLFLALLDMTTRRNAMYFVEIQLFVIRSLGRLKAVCADNADARVRIPSAQECPVYNRVLRFFPPAICRMVNTLELCPVQLECVLDGAAADFIGTQRQKLLDARAREYCDKHLDDFKAQLRQTRALPAKTRVVSRAVRLVFSSDSD